MVQLPLDQKNFFDKKVIKFVVHGLRPLSIVEDQTFCDPIRALKPSYSPPNRRELKRKLDQYQKNLVSSIKMILLDEIKLGNKLTFVIDMWTDRLQKPFGGLLAFFY